MFFAAVLLVVVIPRFYCRFVCPLGALLGIFGRCALWRIGKSEDACRDCRLCSRHCEGACTPDGRIRISECVLCFNCMDDCLHGRIGYRTRPSAAGEVAAPDLSRRQLVTAIVAGTVAIPVMRLSGTLGANWHPGLVRPPGSLDEYRFLSRCIKCGQCMRICPTNVIQPAGIDFGLEALWTPVLNFRIGTSGCQHNCIACGNVCPTSAIRPLSGAERMGQGTFAEQGPLRIGTAFVDRGRCLPWAMDRPCIVCQENCPVSPKAIFTRAHFQTIRLPRPLVVKGGRDKRIALRDAPLEPDRYAGGDYYCRIPGRSDSDRRRIVANSSEAIVLSAADGWELPAAGSPVEIQIRLQQPLVDLARCIGCGVCEHECPVKGLRAIRVTAENESRHKAHRLEVAS
jgi:ferredoxin